MSWILINKNNKTKHSTSAVNKVTRHHRRQCNKQSTVNHSATVDSSTIFYFGEKKKYVQTLNNVINSMATGNNIQRDTKYLVTMATIKFEVKIYNTINNF